MDKNYQKGEKFKSIYDSYISTWNKILDNPEKADTEYQKAIAKAVNKLKEAANNQFEKNLIDDALQLIEEALKAKQVPEDYVFSKIAEQLEKIVEAYKNGKPFGEI